MLGNWIGPIAWALVIRQVARQPLPRVIPEKTCIEVSHCYRQDQDTHLYLLEHSTDGLTPYSCDTLMIGLTLQSALADWWCLHWIPKPADSSVYTDHLRLHPPTLQCHSDAHCISSHNHATPVAGLNSDQCLISPDFVPMSRATAYLSFSPYATFA